MAMFSSTMWIIIIFALYYKIIWEETWVETLMATFTIIAALITLLYFTPKSIKLLAVTSNVNLSDFVNN